MPHASSRKLQDNDIVDAPLGRACEKCTRVCTLCLQTLAHRPLATVQPKIKQCHQMSHKEGCSRCGTGLQHTCMHAAHAAQRPSIAHMPQLPWCCQRAYKAMHRSTHAMREHTAIATLFHHHPITTALSGLSCRTITGGQQAAQRATRQRT